MATIPLQQAIEQAKANPTSDFAKQLRKAIETGQLDEAAQKQGVDLTKYGRTVTQQPQQNVFDRTLENVKEFAKNPVKVGIERLQELAPSENDMAILTGRKQDATPEEIAQAKEKILAFSTSFSTGDIGTAAQNAIKPIKETISSATEKIAETATTAAKNVVPKTKDAFLKFVSPSVDDVAKTSLKKVSTEKFDEFVKVAENAAGNAENPSVYEKVANAMEDATKQIDNQVKSLSEQKATIISKAKNGLTDFTKETGDTVLKINRELSESALAKQFIEKLKTVKTKIDADRAIDDLQNELYKGNKNMTIPVGSKEDRVLRRLVGEYNSKLKSSLPSSYSKINAEIAQRLDTLNVLNTALGETVEGVAIRGAGLIKQFFSPAGTKTKQLFRYIKDKTGVDLATDAVLARYVGDAFGDVKVRSLLEGVPATQTDALNKIIDFAVEKIGAKKAFGEAKTRGILKRGRALTNQNSPK